MGDNMKQINGELITTNWYQKNAMRTLNSFESRDALKLNAYFGVIGEYGEFFDYIKKLYTHNLNDEKKEEVKRLAPKELGDVVWYLSTSLAVYFDYSLDDVYGVIDTEREDDSEYFIDDIYDYVGDDNNEDIFSILMHFKKILNRIDEVENREEIIEVVALVLIKIAEILKDMFNMNLSEVLYLNIDKLRKRYPEGFSTEVSNIRIDCNSRYKEEEEYKVYKK